MFHAVVKLKSLHFRSGINDYATRPPHSLTDALGREIEKYDQLCDTVEAHLVSTAHLFQ